MNSHPEHNVSDEKLSDLLALPSTDAGEDAELTELRAALSSYRTESLDWAERRSAAQPSLAAKAKESRWASVPQWSLAAVAIMAVTASVVHFTGSGGDDVTASTPAVATVSQVAPTSAEEIAADNRLLGSIDKALRYDSVSPIAEFQAKPTKELRGNTYTGVTD